MRRWGGRRGNEGPERRTGENESSKRTTSCSVKRALGLGVVVKFSAEGNEGQVVVSNAMPE